MSVSATRQFAINYNTFPLPGAFSQDEIRERTKLDKKLAYQGSVDTTRCHSDSLVSTSGRCSYRLPIRSTSRSQEHSHAPPAVMESPRLSATASYLDPPLRPGTSHSSTTPSQAHQKYTVRHYFCLWLTVHGRIAGTEIMRELQEF
jgi:hypothetical protein